MRKLKRDLMYQIKHIDDKIYELCTNKENEFDFTKLSVSELEKLLETVNTYYELVTKAKIKKSKEEK